MDEKTTIIQQTIEELIQKMGFTGSVTISKDENDDSITCDIVTDSDSNFLIGQHGINLQALQHLARLIVRKHIPEKIRFTLDINNYRKQKNQSIIQQALQFAEEALSQGRGVIMPPMSTYERRLVHMELSKNSAIKTESIGEGESRKIVVKPANMID
ncbi:MAG: R3H domain protein [Candidatus Moranbacteria bacterium GW2011_GWE1_36_7]|nr:MAG: R3H domain protein [Candidatus Moranbacteria bacterium GW2011_GWD2_36_12]KKQ06383.1 MAG: R3H domain protein [Candidatus Moranbacteria bacterium GW2011_GWE2_36_40]KKQ14823.1 MAG: R3H domain protein [Candidatus Moranbacteria bacterium GW2011_GWE1_36_7]